MGDKKFSSKIGFILSAAGSAVGLGNLWRFPYLAAKYGGGTFLLIYLILTVTFGFSMMLTEIAIGRKTGKSILGAYGALNKKFKFIGYLSGLVPVIIFPYYCVIGGWVLKYMTTFLAGESQKAVSADYFTGFITGTAQPVVFLFVFLAATAVIVVFGVQKGIEKANKIMMPALIIMTVLVAVYGLTVPGALDGLVYYLKPDFGKFSFNAVAAAAGQLFYSLSLAMGIMVTYGSYMKKEDNIETCVKQIEIFDTGVAFLAGLIIIPAIFTFGEKKEAILTSGPSLMFITLPKVFSNMRLGWLVGAVFFVLVFFAALTSSISLMETIVAMVEEKTGWKRVTACIITGLFSFALALPSALGFGALSGVNIIGMSFLDFFDFISNSVLMPIVALLMCIFVGYVLKTDAIAEEISESESFKRRKLYDVIIKYVAPVFLVIILITSILSSFKIISL
ncbi:MAG: neurotransmitter:Na+ symporter, family [Clostridiales bacterium]|nr:neurotransmitter:Na+ symporter, family [Clostridiales bacterium]